MKKKIFKIVVIELLILAMVGIALSYDWRTNKPTGGFVVFLNGETLQGFVCKSTTDHKSRLVVVYPTTNSAFVYGPQGQDVFDSNVVGEYLRGEIGIDKVKESTVAIIKPIEQRGL